MNWIKEGRQKVKLTQQHLADKVGVSKTTVRRWEVGTTEPKMSQVKVLNKIFKIRRKV